jgi:hypothetical protein
MATEKEKEQYDKQWGKVTCKCGKEMTRLPGIEIWLLAYFWCSDCGRIFRKMHQAYSSQNSWFEPKKEVK